MQICTVEKDGKTIGVFSSVKELLTFLYLHADDFGFADNGENLVDTFVGKNVSKKLQEHLLPNIQVKEWRSNTDTYTKNEDEYGKDVDSIAKNRPQKSWSVTMKDNTKQTIVAAFMSLAVTQAKAEYILDNGKYMDVKEIKEE